MAEVTITKGNILDAKAEALVNAVNCVGVMKKGLALQFANKYPSMLKEYARVCEKGDLSMGKVHVWVTPEDDSHLYVINFPTKLHWKDPSRLPYIEQGLQELRRQLHALKVKSVAIPALGCGHGGLDWNIVKNKIIDALADLETHVYLYAPLPEA